MRPSRQTFLLMFALSLNSSCRSTDAKLKADDTEDVACEVVIVGGGVGGLHTAFRLGPDYGAKVCLFEKETRLGGRVYDLVKNADGSDGPYLGAGARRLMVGQDVVFKLANELGVELQKPQTGADLIYARGMYSTDKDAFLKLYPGVVYDHSKPDAETQLLQQLLTSPERANAAKYPNFVAYVKAVVGADGFQYLHDMSRFRGDFEYPLSARSYLDFLAEEIDLCCQTFYPVGGMSAFVRAMEARARASGVRIFTGEAVATIDATGKGKYVLTTSKRRAAAGSVIIAVPPVAFSHIGGAIAQQIQARPEFQSLIGIKVTVINQWFDQAWWENMRTPSGQNIWRAYTTGHCISYVEIPPEPYAAAQHAIRTVYNDQRECADKWSDLAKGPQDKLEAELHAGLVHMFGNNQVTTPVTIPPASKTAYWEWPDGWYWLKDDSPFTNADIFKWAVQPLPGEAVALVSEAYNPQRSAWTDAAYKSSINLLNAKYGMTLSGLTPGTQSPVTPPAKIKTLPDATN